MKAESTYESKDTPDPRSTSEWANDAVARLEKATGDAVPGYVCDALYGIERMDVEDARLPEEVHDCLKIVEDMEFGPGRKPLKPEGAMSRAESQRRHEIRKKIKKYHGMNQLMSQDEGEFIELTEALERFKSGREIGTYDIPVFEKYGSGSVDDIDGRVSKHNRYVKLLFMVSEEERSARSMKRRLGINYRRLATLVDHPKADYGLFEKDGSYIRVSERGKEFLHALFPYLKKDRTLPDLA